ncbi:hypothetical protein D6C77_04782 [Aureobasidium pullulans]|uniref:Wings apart-like protein C-terminal domain-containing protein n=1 Tax=Aureobasidium pullulans TaxID=5580 RepID=A0A4S8T1I9_AURPU|nr:hypothetical protein D6D28_00181 [Aureobasidium pullulans]THX30279.1 hypothetical protein D6D12_03640 [Aureobasidium pullulans]THX63218.1 hypothetical protein D6D11_01945 [Aureobasidium pullulans]THY64839.1 hypothetical protein D6C99_00089 [Aureobasidium pullulans]TIA25829.1 hypothetical protein D6C81_01385 [Aureobasidium pullulans]
MTALPGPSSYATGDRRKRPVVTYGRPARNSTFSANSVKTFYDDSKKIASPSKLKRPTTSTARKTLITNDEFDVPMSDDEPVSVPPKSKKLAKASPKNDLATASSVSKGDGGLASTSPRKRKRTVSQTTQASSTQDPKVDKSQQFETEASHSVSESAQLRRSRRQIAAESSVTSNPSSFKVDQKTATTRKPVRSLTRSACPLSPVFVSPVTGSPISPADSVSTTSTTPKQKKLWHDLLLSDPVDTDTYEPNTTSRPLSTHPVAQSNSSTLESRIAPTSGESKARIVDRLKEKVTSTHSSDESSDEELDELQEEPSSQINGRPTTSAQSVPQESTQYSQSQARTQTLQLSTSKNAKKVTYARSRTYLQDSLEDMIFGDLPMVAPERPAASARRTKASPMTKSNAKVTFNNESDDDTAQGIRSIHELRAAGNKSRFLDEVTRLVDDIKNPKPSSRSQRRMALMELSTTLAENTSASRFIEHGFDANIIAQFQYARTDILADMLLCVVVTRIAQASTSLLHGGVLDFLSSYLGETKDISNIARERKSNMSKVAQSDYLEFMEKVRTADAWDNCPPDHLSPSSLALMSMDCIFVTHRRNKNSGTILSPDTASKLVGLATHHVSTPGGSSQAITNRALSALEAATTLDVESASSEVWSVETLSRVASALPGLLKMSIHSQELALRFCCSVTNDNEENSGVFSQHQTIHLIMSLIIDGFSSRGTLSEEEASVSHDLLVLALGLMINLTSVCEVAREYAARAEDEKLAALVDIFVRGQKKAAESQSEEEMQANIPYGWLSVLLGYICLDRITKERVRSLLPGKSEAVLVDAVEGIALMSQQVDSQAAEEKEETSSGFTQKLMALVARLREGA